MKKILLLILLILIGVAIYKFKNPNTAELDDVIEQKTEQIKKELGLPKKINDYIIMEDMYYGKPRDLYIDLKITNSQISEFIKHIASNPNNPNVKKSRDEFKRIVCNQPKTRIILELVDAAHVAYIYQGDEILVYTVKKEDCR